MAETEAAEMRVRKGYATTLAPDASPGTVSAMYDDWSEKYDEDYIDLLGYYGPSKTAEILGEVCTEKDCRIVDWACGTGLVGVELYEKGFINLTAADISEKSLEVAAKKGVYKRTVKLGDSRLIFRNDEYDAVVCCGAMIPNHVKPDILHEWARIVKPGGLIVVVTRDSYLHLTKGQEHYFSEQLKHELEEVIEELQSKEKLIMISDKDFIGYHKLPLAIQGRSFVFRVI